MTIKIYEVGGCVRDRYLGIKSNDIDYAIEAESYDSMKRYVSTKFKILYEKPEFLTIKARKQTEQQVFDFVLCRKDGLYRDSRRPENVSIGTIYDDLRRRDFTMNSIAIDTMTGDIIDPHKGIQDLSNKLIRCTGNTEERMKEDALRLVRAFRFLVVLRFKLHSEIEDCLNNDMCISLLEKVHTERIVNEMSKCFDNDSYLTVVCLHKYPLFMKHILNRIQLKPHIIQKHNAT